MFESRRQIRDPEARRLIRVYSASGRLGELTVTAKVTLQLRLYTYRLVGDIFPCPRCSMRDSHRDTNLLSTMALESTSVFSFAVGPHDHCTYSTAYSPAGLPRAGRTLHQVCIMFTLISLCRANILN